MDMDELEVFTCWSFATLICEETFRLPLSSGRGTAAGSGCGLRRKPYSKTLDCLLDSFLLCRRISTSHSSAHHLLIHLLPRHNTPGSDQVIRVPRKQCLSIRAPRQTHTLRLPALLAHGRVFGLQLVNLALLLEIEDDDGARRRGAEPVSVRGEDEGVDLIAGAQRVEVLGLVKVPKHGRAVFATGCT